MKRVFLMFSSFAVLFTANVPTLRAQSLEPFNPYGIFSPGVEAWQMTRYGNLTPSLYTGAMTFSLPLYTYEDLDFTIPISLEYSFDGYRPAQHSGTVGYGWYLNCGGVITREVQGIPDEGVIDQADYSMYRVAGWLARHDNTLFHGTTFNGYYSIGRREGYLAGPEMTVSMMQSYNVFTDTPMETFRDGSNNWMYDPAPDIWHFSFLGHSGDFIIGNDGKAIVYNSDIPGDEITITFQTIEPTPRYSTIKLITGDGMEFLFCADGYSEAHSSVPTEEFAVSESLTSWRLSRITAPNGRSVIFNFNREYTTTIHKRYDSETDGMCSDNSLFTSNEPMMAFTTITSSRRWTVIKEEYYSMKGVDILGQSNELEAAVRMQYSPATGNENAMSCFECDPAAVIDTGPQALMTELCVYNRERETVERVNLNYQCSSSGVPKAFLSSVCTRRNGRWSFDYNLEGYSLPKNDTESTDHWGFWNGKNVNDFCEHLTQRSTIVLQEAYDEWVMEGDSLILHHVPAVTTNGIPQHLYDQIVDDSKEAEIYYGVCGALSKITYPTGGATHVDYESNQAGKRLNAYFGTRNVIIENVPGDGPDSTYIVGGVRVKRLTDVDTSGKTYETSFEYTDSSGMCSGILMQMPRYTDRAYYFHSLSGSFANQNTNCYAIVQALVYSNACGFQLSRDGHIAYRTVRKNYPDGSSTVQEFTTAATPGLEDVRSEGTPVIKHVICDVDIISPVNPTEVRTAPISCSRSGLRGKVIREITEDKFGNEIRRVENTYSNRYASVSGVCFNSPYQYESIASFACYWSTPASRTETLHGVTTRAEYAYNNKGQIIREDLISGIGATTDTTRTEYVYLHGTQSPSWFVSNPSLRSAKASAVRKRIKNGLEMKIAEEHYYYGNNGNPKPIRISVFPAGGGADSLTTTCTYDSRFRLTGLSTQPGEVNRTYTWSGNNLAASSVLDIGSGDISTTVYQWQDMVGPTTITRPSGYSTHYGYDSASRLSSVFDSKGNPINTYSYNLVNQ